MNSDEFYEYEDRAYINPTLSSGEQEAFIDNLRNIQGQNNTQIAQQTYNLGTDVSSNLGGLGGGESYFMSRYQTPQVDEMVATLKSAAQAQALNDVMSNYQSQLKQRYNSAYRKAQKRARAAAAAAAAGSPGTNDVTGNVKTKTTQQPINGKYDELALRNFTGKTKVDALYEDIHNLEMNRQAAERAAQAAATAKAKSERSWIRNALVSPFETVYNGMFGGTRSSGGGSW